MHDVFICHASEDKDDLVRPLAEALRSHHLEVWYDEFTLNIGDSLSETIDRGLATSQFGIVVLSPHFFHKRWPKRELSGLVAREAAEDRHLILPVWHNVRRDEVLEFSPPLADLLATSSSAGLDRVVSELLRKLRPEESPLIVARDFLIQKGLTPPVITDEWWLDIVESKEAELRYPDLNLDWRWIFPLPYPYGDRGKERGLNIAWTALQLDWAAAGKERRICQLTHPDIVHEFLKEWPGLFECARANPAILALYAPQLTLPGYDVGFEDVFDELNDPSKASICDFARYGKPDTTDGKEPLCGDFIAWRHPTYGNYTPDELSYVFVNAHNAYYSRQSFDGFECLVWLLSNASGWMPDDLKQTLIAGYRERQHWWVKDFCEYDNTGTVYDVVFNKTPSKFAYTKSLRSALRSSISRALHALGFEDNGDAILSRFIELAFIEGYYEEQERNRARRKGK